MADTAHLVQVRVPRPEAVAWKRAAAKEERTLSALVRIAVREHLRKPRGHERDHEADARG
jgi:hypothetical protein